MIDFSLAELSLMKRDKKSRLQQQLLIERWSGQDVYGQASYLPVIRCFCRVQNQQEIIRDQRGQEIVSKTNIYVDSAVVVGLKDRITLPDGTQPPILQVKSLYDGLGRIDQRIIYA